MSNKFLDLNGLSRYKEKSDEELNALLSAKANKDGYYKQLVAGLAENLVDTKGTGSEQEFTDRTSCGDESISDDGSGVIKELRGNSLAWNQMVPLKTTTTNNGITFTQNANGSVTVNGTATANAVFELIGFFVLVPGHKFILRGGHADDGLTSQMLAVNKSGHWSDIANPSVIFQADLSSDYRIMLRVANGVTVSNKVFWPNLTDLTLMFGAGKEPSTVAEFESLYNELYYPQNNGEIINNAADTLVTDGFNQWDEQWDEGGFDGTTGQPISGNQIRSKNYTPVFGGVSYCFSVQSARISNVFWYDENKNYLGYIGNSTESVFVTESPAKARFVMFQFPNAYGLTYKNDACVNLSWSGYRDGEYEPYWKRETGVDMRKIYGKLNGAGEMVQVFPAGGRSAGDAFDSADLVRKEADVRVGSVDMGTLTWGYENTYAYLHSSAISDFKSASDNYITARYVSGGYRGQTYMGDADDKTAYRVSGMIFVKDSAYSDAATFKAAMNGVMLNYELATPLHYTDLMYSEDGGQTFIDIPTVFKVADFGTERIRPLVDAQGNPVTAPFRAVIQYNDDFTREIVNLPKNYDTTDGIDDAIAAIASALGTALNGTLTVTRGAYNPATKKYAWSSSFTPNENTE